MSIDLYRSKKQCQFQRKRKLSAVSESTESTDDENNCEKQNLIHNEKKHVEKKYKTELCKNFSETGSCPYRKKCKFAHGLNQLNEGKKEQGRFYRTKKCNSFWNEGTCAYGQRCQFLHIKVERSTTQCLESWRVAIQMQTNESGFAGSKLLRLLRIE